MNNPQITEFASILLFILGGIIFVGMGLLTASFLRPKRPNPEKLIAYECGEEPVGGAWGRFPIQYYIVALIFILFEVEIVFLFPWAIVFGRKDLIHQSDGIWGWFSLGEIFLFIFLLVLGLAYVWVKGYLDWIPSHKSTSSFESKIPSGVYEEVNQRYAQKSQVDV